MSEVYKAISKVQAEIAKVGISKDRKNSSQNYQFRGIDDMYNVLSSLVANAGLVMIPRVTGRESEYLPANKNGTVMHSVTIEMEYDFVSSVDGSKHTAKVYGEAQDSGDKATNKAMSAAHKYALVQTFLIPTEGDNDTENSSPEPRQVVKKPPMSAQEASNLRGLLKQVTTADETKICKGYTAKEGYKINSLEEVPVVYFEEIAKKLEQLIKEKK